MKAGATVIAISTDSPATSRKFKVSLKAPYHFVADAEGELVTRYDVKMPLVTVAKRVTLVVGAGRKVLSREEGSAAIDPSGAIAACSLKPPSALRYVTEPDGGSR